MACHSHTNRATLAHAHKLAIKRLLLWLLFLDYVFLFVLLRDALYKKQADKLCTPLPPNTFSCSVVLLTYLVVALAFHFRPLVAPLPGMTHGTHSASGLLCNANTVLPSYWTLGMQIAGSSRPLIAKKQILSTSGSIYSAR